jgi:hypothetical protein
MGFAGKMSMKVFERHHGIAKSGSIKLKAVV